MISFILKVQCCWFLFFIFYYLFIRKETFFHANRFYLIVSLALGLLIPILPSLSLFQNISSSTNINSIISLSDQTYSEIVFPITGSVSTVFNWSLLIIWIYLIGSFYSLGRFVFGLAKIYRIFLEGEKIKNEDHLLVKANHPSLAFSFFNLLFVGNQYKEQEYSQVINHELTHVKGKHSLDIVFVEILNVFFWFSPIIYWYKKAIRITHEYIADHQVIATVDKTDYGRLLISHVHPSSLADFANFIFRSPLKTRIQMMYSKRTSKSGILKYFSILPLTLFILVFFSNSSIKAELKNIDQNFELTEVSNDTIPPTPPSPPTPPLSINPPTSPVPPSPPKAVKPAAPKGTIKAPIPPKAINQIPNPPAPPISSEETFIVVEEMPRFPGCEDLAGDKQKCSTQKLITFISTNLKYPEEAKKAGIEGKVMSSFIVDKNGNIKDIEILKSLGHGCDLEVVRILELMNNMQAKWVPGKQRSKSVSVKLNLPFSFVLPKK